MRKAILIVSAATLIAGCRPTPDYVHGPKDVFGRMERNSP